MHKTRFIWLKNPWNLTEAQHRRLSELEHLNLKINRAYLPQSSSIRAFLDLHAAPGWVQAVPEALVLRGPRIHAELPPLRDFAWRLRRHEKDILNYFRMPIDNGTVAQA